MIVASIMTRKTFKVRMDDTIGTLREILQKVEFHHLLVVENLKLVGIISDRDVLKAISPFLNTLSEHTRDLTVLNKKAHQIMTRRPITVARDVNIETAADLLMNNAISCLPVTSSDGEIEGIVTWKDILRFYIQTRRKPKPIG